jgi:pimeloyl-ACP methyl ester carboxylesterase
MRPKDKKYLDTSDSSDSFESRLGRIQYYVWNETGRKTILLLHGWESNSARWRFLINTLNNADYKIVSLDAPAHGASGSNTFDMLQYAEAIYETVEKFKVDILMGHSAGGLAISFYLSRFKHPVFDAIVLLGSPSGLRQIIGNYYAILKPSSRVKRLLEKHFEETFNLKIEDLSAPKMIKGNTIPTLIIHDKQDTSIKLADAKEHEQLFVNSKLIVTDGYGHGLQNKKVFAAIKEFLESDLIMKE